MMVDGSLCYDAMNSEGKDRTPRVDVGTAWELRAHSAMHRFSFSCVGWRAIAATVWVILPSATGWREGV